jgi:hypothetical protein
MKKPCDFYSRLSLFLWIPLALAATACSAESSNQPGSRHNLPGDQSATSGAGGGVDTGSGGSSFVTTPYGGAGGMSGAAGQTQPAINDSPKEEETCGEATIEPVIELVPGNLMVIFDRSVSMNEIFENTTRINAAYFAILEGIQAFACAPDDPDCEEQLNVAAILLPSAPGGVGMCYVEDINSPQQINWMSATQFVSAWQNYWHANPYPDPFVLVLGTPIIPAFQHAADAIATANHPGITAVLFITDGLGTCGQGTPAYDQAANWLQQGIKTHVVSVASFGLLFPADVEGQAFNDKVALAGGTDRSLNPTDVATLNTALSEIIQTASAAPSCEVRLEGGELIDLESACERGTVTINGEPIACDQQNKTDGFWVKGPDLIELVGSACEKLQAQGQLSASFPCDVIVVY